MRRPNLCSNSIAVADDAYKPANNTVQKEEGRLSLVRRVLGGSRKKDGNNSNSKIKQFGVPLSDLPLHNNSVPKVLHRICFFLEAYGMKVEGLFRICSGNSTLIENLKVHFNNEGDIDLDVSNDIVSIALLLVVWLKELPQPLFPQETIKDLVSLMHKYEGDTWWGPVCHECIISSGTLSTNVLDEILHLLHNYTAKHPSSMSYIPGVFGPLLTCREFNDISSLDAVHLTSKFIQDYHVIFRKRNIELLDCLSNEHKAIVISEHNSSQKQKKRKEKQENCSRHDRKFVRSNSEERPAINSSCAGNARAESMRRVSSHEDFSKAKQNQNKVDPPSQLKKMALPLHERNSCSPQRQHPYESIMASSTVGYASDLYDENEHERRRNSERFAPQCHRNGGRRRRTKHHHSSLQAKENESFELKVQQAKKVEQTPQKNYYAVPIIPGPQLNNPEKANKSADGDVIKKETDAEEEEDRTPSPISGVGSPTLDLNTYLGQDDVSTEPVPSTPWNNISPSEERLVSPRNSLVMSRRTFTANLGSLSSCDDDPTLLELATQINNIKHKIKKYEEGFEREFGYKPSYADKMANPDTKKMCHTLGKLKKQLKAAKEECMKVTSCVKRTLKEDVIQEIEKRLYEKRVACNRGENLELMTHEQLVEEKVAMQKALLQLEASFGRPSSKEERDLVRDLYDRYRTVKRMLLRHAPSKMKDSVTELGTILEHEAMDFSTSPPPTSPGASIEDESPPPERKTPELVLDNLHSLPRNELLQLQKVTREEKKRLRRNLKEYEQDFQIKTGRRLQKDERCPLEPSYVDYKNAKAKLRFIDALVTKLK